MAITRIDHGEIYYTALSTDDAVVNNNFHGLIGYKVYLYDIKVWKVINDDFTLSELVYNVSGSSSGGGETSSSTLIQGNITLIGSAQQLNSDTSCKNVTIQAEPDNSGYVYIGKLDVSSTSHMFTLSAGSSVTINASNLNLIYVIGTSGEKVCYGGEA